MTTTPVNASRREDASSKRTVLEQEIQLALQIESNSPGGWATQLRKALQDKSAELDQFITKAQLLMLQSEVARDGR